MKPRATCVDNLRVDALAVYTCRYPRTPTRTDTGRSLMNIGGRPVDCSTETVTRPLQFNDVFCQPNCSSQLGHKDCESIACFAVTCGLRPPSVRP